MRFEAARRSNRGAAKYNGGSSTRGNSALFGLYGSYTHEDGYYADAMVSGGYTGFQTRRSIEFSTINRTASADPNSGQFSAALNLGKDFEIGKFRPPDSSGNRMSPSSTDGQAVKI